MSQNKTVVPGLESGNVSTGMGGNNFNPYAREASAAPKGTVVPGMKFAGMGNEHVKAEPKAHQPSNNQVMSGKPVVGFLYSVSRTSAGEFWPLHIGPNTIGQSADCDIVLPEATVSARHADIMVRKMKNPVKVIASISDSRSTNGTMLNGESLAFDAVGCKSGDVITIGDNYELLLILIDVNDLGLKVSENFIAVEETDPNDIYEEPENNQTHLGGSDEPPMFNGTVGLDGSSANSFRGGTKGI